MTDELKQAIHGAHQKLPTTPRPRRQKVSSSTATSTLRRNWRQSRTTLLVSSTSPHGSSASQQSKPRVPTLNSTLGARTTS